MAERKIRCHAVSKEDFWSGQPDSLTIRLRFCGSNGVGRCDARSGGRVLLIEADPQGRALDWAAARSDEPMFTVVGFERPTVHKEITRLKQGYNHVVIDGPPRVTD